jgi:type VII secretion-associated serine protease mycosin
MSTRRVSFVLACLTAVALGIIGTPGIAHADTIRHDMWHLKYLHVAEAQAIAQGEGVTVAVVDAGVDGNHPDLKGNVEDGTYGSWDDHTGHGTGMASLIAGHGHGPGHRDGALGLAPKARVLPVLAGKGSGRGAADDIIRGIRWATDHGANVINLSGGVAGRIGRVCTAVNYALSKDVVVVASAGNTANGYDEVISPANCPGAVAVSGSNQDGNFTDESVEGQEVGLSAPATEIVFAGLRSRTGYGVGTGTSPSAALVSGTAALIRSKYPDSKAKDVIQRLIATADDRGPKGRDPQYGYGIVDPLKALTADVPEVDRNPLLKPSTKPVGTAKSGGSKGGWCLAALGIPSSAGLILAGVFVGRRRQRGTAPAQHSPWQ